MFPLVEVPKIVKHYDLRDRLKSKSCQLTNWGKCKETRRSTKLHGDTYTLESSGVTLSRIRS